MSLTSALFGDEHALSAIEQMLENDGTILEALNDTNNNQSEHCAFDEEVNANLTKITRRRRKSAPDDVQIIAEQYQKTKDERLWKRLQERLYRPLLKYINGMTKNQMLAEDAVAISFARANERIDEYDASKSKFSTWLWTISYRQCLYDMKIDNRIDTVSYDTTWLDEDRSSSACNPDLLNVCQKLNQTTDNYYIIDNDNNVTGLSASDVTKRLYDVSLNVISEIKNPVTKSVIEMKLVHEMTIKDISEALNMNQSNVKNHLYKGKSELANAIKTQYDDLYDLYLDTLVDADNAADMYCA